MAKSSIVPWFNPANSALYPLRLVALDWTKDRDAITIRAARDGDKPDDLFDPTSQLGDLWLTLKGSKHNVSSINLSLYGDQINPETGNAFRIEAEIRNETKPEYGYAYTPKQLAAFTPKYLFLGANTAMRGAPPWFSCSVLPYQRTPRSNPGRVGKPKPSIVRLTAAPATPPAGQTPPRIPRQRA